MDNKSVLEVIRNLHFMPTWEFEGLDFYNGTVMVRAQWETYNSNQSEALKGYPQRVVLERTAVIRSRSFKSADDLEAALFTWLMEIQIHESREFFRVGSEFRAPFHPHRPEGDAQWNRQVIDATTSPMTGLHAFDL